MSASLVGIVVHCVLFYFQFESRRLIQSACTCYPMRICMKRLAFHPHLTLNGIHFVVLGLNKFLCVWCLGKSYAKMYDADYFLLLLSPWGQICLILRRLPIVVVESGLCTW